MPIATFSLSVPAPARQCDPGFVPRSTSQDRRGRFPVTSQRDFPVAFSCATICHIRIAVRGIDVRQSFRRCSRSVLSDWESFYWSFRQYAKVQLFFNAKYGPLPKSSSCWHQDRCRLYRCQRINDSAPALRWPQRARKVWPFNCVVYNKSGKTALRSVG